MMVVEAFTHRPVTTWYTTNSKANDKNWCDQLLERLPIGGLLIFDLARKASMLRAGGRRQKERSINKNFSCGLLPKAYKKICVEMRSTKTQGVLTSIPRF